MKSLWLRNLWHPRRLYGELQGQRRLRVDPALWNALEPILRKSASVGCSFYELATLYAHVVEHKPAKVLELGSGISTIVMGFAAWRVRQSGRPCFIVSMEQHSRYFEDLRRLLPKEIEDCVRLILSPVNEREGPGGRIAGYYELKPEDAYGLVFIDGPQNIERRHDLRYFDGDILDAIAWNDAAFTTFVDGRRGTVNNLRTLLPWAGIQHNPHHKFTQIAIPELTRRI